MAKAQYPNAHDLEEFLLSAGFSATFLADFDLETWAAAGRRSFERQVGRRMLATSQTREFEPPTNPRGYLAFDEDLWPSVVPTLTYDGAAIVAGTDYRLLPVNAADAGGAYTSARFYRRWAAPVAFSLGAVVAITGLWGYATAIPEDAWLGMLAAAAVEMFPLIQHSKTRGLQMWREADMAEQYGSDPLSGLRDGWLLTLRGTEKMPGGVIARYRNVRVG